MLRVQDKYFHINCFKCQGKLHSVAPGGVTFTLSSKHHNTSVLVFTASKNEELILNCRKTKPTNFFSHMHCNVEKCSEHKGVRTVCLVVKVRGLPLCIISRNCMKWRYIGEFFPTRLQQRSWSNVICGIMHRKLPGKFAFGLYKLSVTVPNHVRKSNKIVIWFERIII